jgi:LEA14-like dessication related protein
MKKITLIYFFTLLLLSFVSCSTLKQLAQPPELSFKSLGIDHFSLEGMTLNFLVNAKNPNPFPLPFSGLSYGLKINNQALFNGNFNGDANLGSSEQKNVTLPVQIKFKDFIGSIANLVTQKEFKYQLTSSYKVLGFDIPLKHEGTLALPSLPKIQFDGIKLNHLGFTEAELGLKLNVKNLNAFKIPLGAIMGQLKLGENQTLVDIQQSNLAPLEANQSSQIQIPIKLNVLTMGSALIKQLQGGSLPIKLKGGLSLSQQPSPQDLIPFDFNTITKLTQ